MNTDIAQLKTVPLFSNMNEAEIAGVCATLDENTFAPDVLTTLGRRLYRTDTLLRKSISKSINEIEQERMTFGQRLADGFATMMGSWGFIIIQSCILAVWVAWNAIAGIHNQHHPESH